MGPKPKIELVLEDCQGENPEGEIDAEEYETITLTYRDDEDQVVGEIEFNVSVEEGIRFHWWMVSQGISSS